MTETELYPLVLHPVYKDYLWGGDRIIRTYRRNEPSGIYAESWEVSDRPEGASRVANGPLRGSSLGELVSRYRAELVGEGFSGGRFPILIKLIDARERLSVQVHPDDEAALRLGAEPKTEAWYVLDADPGARVFAGLRPGVGRDELLNAMTNKNFESILRSVSVSQGDVIFIPGGRVHAIDAGCLLYEVQQNSNTTYRLYDWDRVGPDGKPRPLHIEQALACIHFDDHADPRARPRLVAEEPVRRWQLLKTRYFVLEKVELDQRWELEGDRATFQVFFLEEGRVECRWSGQSEVLERGTSLLIPAAAGRLALNPQESSTRLLRVTRGEEESSSSGRG